MEIEKLFEEIEGYYKEIENLDDGEHLWDSYQRVIAIMMRVSHIRTELAWREVKSSVTTPEKKFRTMILDPFIERLHELATFESRKITAKGIELQMEK